MLDLLASRRGKQGLGSLSAILERLRREGWLKAEPNSDAGAGSDLVYSLTVLGGQRVKEESARLGSMLSEFVEQDEMDKSFGKFLDRRRLAGYN
jgi:DNA-binding PadR family transcriptional regulator